jgi:hypothetical protein
VKLYTALSPFNSRLAEVLIPTFPAGAHAAEDGDGTLLMRVPTPSPTHPDHIGSHVAVSLEKSVREALETASVPDRELMMQTLVDSLASQIQIQYNPNAVGQFAMDFVGTMNTLEGLLD